MMHKLIEMSDHILETDYLHLICLNRKSLGFCCELIELSLLLLKIDICCSISIRVVRSGLKRLSQPPKL